MSHTILFNTNYNAGSLIPVQLTIVNYVSGGEAVSSADVNGVTVDGVIFAQVPPAKNSLNVVLFPILDGGKIRLFQFVGGVPTEIPSTTALNAVIVALVLAS